MKNNEKKKKSEEFPGISVQRTTKERLLSLKKAKNLKSLDSAITYALDHSAGETILIQNKFRELMNMLELVYPNNERVSHLVSLYERALEVYIETPEEQKEFENRLVKFISGESTIKKDK